jgi:hypothetical protein
MIEGSCGVVGSSLRFGGLPGPLAVFSSLFLRPPSTITQGCVNEMKEFI